MAEHRIYTPAIGARLAHGLGSIPSVPTKIQEVWPSGLRL